jgi:hypothetical protein
MDRADSGDTAVSFLLDSGALCVLENRNRNGLVGGNTESHKGRTAATTPCISLSNIVISCCAGAQQSGSLTRKFMKPAGKPIASAIGQFTPYRRRGMWLFLFLYGVFLFLQLSYQPREGDFWEHAAVLRELSIHPFHPHHPLLDLAIPHAFFSPYLVFLGGVSYYLKLNYFSVIGAAGTINAALFLLGFYLLCRTYVPRSRSFVPLVSIVLSTFLWPKGFLVWSGFYQFDTIGYVLSYPSTFAFDTSCILVYFAHSRRAEPTVGQALVIGVGTSIVILTHPLTALFLLTALGAIYFEELATRVKSGYAPPTPILVVGIAIVLISVGATLTWPYYSILARVYGGDWTAFDHDSAMLYNSFTSQPAGFLSFVVAAPFIARVGFRRLRCHPLDCLCVTWGGLCVIYIAGLVCNKMSLGRVISEVHILSCLFIADGLRTLFLSKRPLVGSVASAVILTTMLLLNGLNVGPLGWASRALVGEVFPWSRLEFVRRYVGPDEVVLANAGMGNMIAAFAGRVVVSDRPLHWVPDAAKRRQVVSAIFDANATLEMRCRAMAAYRTDFILVTQTEKSSLVALQKLGTTVYEDKEYTLIRVSAAPSATREEPLPLCGVDDNY